MPPSSPSRAPSRVAALLRDRRSALGGAIGPAGFVAAWVAGGAIKEAYSPIHDAISRLAAHGASTRPLMTAGFVCFGIAVPVYSAALKAAMPGPAWIAALTSGLGIIGVALAPLEHSPTVDTLHAIAAGIGYIGLASTSLLSAWQFSKVGAVQWTRLGIVAGTISSICLVLSTTDTANGLFQRIGLTTGDVFLAASGLAIASGRFPTFDKPAAGVGLATARR